MYNTSYYLDAFDNLKLYYDIIQVSQGNQNPYQVVYNHLYNYLFKTCIKNIFNLR